MSSLALEQQTAPNERRFHVRRELLLQKQPAGCAVIDQKEVGHTTTAGLTAADQRDLSQSMTIIAEARPTASTRGIQIAHPDEEKLW